MLEHPTISLVIPVHNGGAAFTHCLESVGRLQPPPLEVVVVVDGNADDFSAEAIHAKTRVIRLPQRGGPARARNHGAACAQGQILLFIDADVAVPPDLCRRVAEGFHAAPDTAAIIGSYDCEPAAPGLISQYKNLLHHYVHQCADEVAATFWGACGAIRREVFLAMGGFDERYRRPCVEDIDLGYRLRAAQHTLRLQRTLQVKHLKRWTFLSLLKSDILDRALPWTELIMRYRMFRNDLNLRHSDRLSVAAIYALLLTALAGAWSPSWLLVAGSLVVPLLVLNRGAYRFFMARRGIAFAAAAIALHWLSLIYGGAAFAVGIIRYGLAPGFRVACSSGRSPEPFSADRQPGAVIPRLGNPREGGA